MYLMKRDVAYRRFQAATALEALIRGFALPPQLRVDEPEHRLRTRRGGHDDQSHLADLSVSAVSCLVKPWWRPELSGLHVLIACELGKQSSATALSYLRATTPSQPLHLCNRPLLPDPRLSARPPCLSAPLRFHMAMSPR